MATIPLTQGKRTEIDDADMDVVSRHSWSFGTGYAQSKIRGKLVRLHRFLMNPPDGLTVDHIDGNPLNNRRSNLRICDQQKQTWNTRKRKGGQSSKFKGVSWLPGRMIWRAVIKFNGKSKLVGFFASEVEAAFAYNKAAKQYRQEYAALNFPNVSEMVFTQHPNRCNVCNKLFKNQRGLKIHKSGQHK
jgi:hypothetical protein